MSGHIPFRTCLGCRQTKAKNELVRIALTPAGEVVLDTCGRGGRGVYFCPSISCIKAGFKKSSYLSYALRTQLSPQDLGRLMEALMCHLKERGMDGG